MIEKKVLRLLLIVIFLLSKNIARSQVIGHDSIQLSMMIGGYYDHNLNRKLKDNPELYSHSGFEVTTIIRPRFRFSHSVGFMFEASNVYNVLKDTVPYEPIVYQKFASRSSFNIGLKYGLHYRILSHQRVLLRSYTQFSMYRILASGHGVRHQIESSSTSTVDRVIRVSHTGERSPYVYRTDLGLDFSYAIDRVTDDDNPIYFQQGELYVMASVNYRTSRKNISYDISIDNQFIEEEDTTFNLRTYGLYVGIGMRVSLGMEKQ